MYSLALSDSFEYLGLCYLSTAIIINMFTLIVQGLTLDVRQILTTKVGPRAVRVNNKILIY